MAINVLTLAAASLNPADAAHAHRHARPAHHNASATRSNNGPVVAVLPGVLDANALAMPDQPFTLRSWDGTVETLRKRALIRSPSWSAIMIDNTLLQSACRDGLVQMLPAPSPAAPNTSPSPCGIPAGQNSIVLAWDQHRATAAPNWGDFWDVARHPGKRGLRLDPRSTLEIALLADGVPANGVYATLSTADGVDRAFRKLDQLRPYIVWWRTPEDAARIMDNGSALMTSTPADELAGAERKSGFAAQWHQSLRQNLSWAVPHNVPDADARRVTGILREQNPHHDDAPDNMTPDSGSLTIDDGFWTNHLDDLESRFQTWFNAKP